ncbi:MAG TPA: protein kinase [Anaerolineaceae bacterium]|nr:protein kinase [Anaerolineaceae bacterium]HPN50266.1 protein kinase [Anaerolineaceae bacterium]
MPQTCPHCGQTHRAEAAFCPVTGKPLSIPAPQPPPPPPPVVIPPAAPFSQVDPAAASNLTGRLPANALLKNRYVIIEKVGQGGMAAVYKVADLLLPGATWAVKEMSDTAIVEPEEKAYAVRAFQQESSLLQQLDHPTLPKVIDSFTENNKHYLVMEFIQGQTLESVLIQRGAPFSEFEVLHWAVQLCDVLVYLHNCIPPIIFRDLKPSNIMLMPDGQVKLFDFGIARFFKPGQKKDTIAIGTPGFASPEALDGQTDGRSDLYSLCVTVYNLLTRYDPVKSLFSLPPIRKINPAISAEMERILIKGLQFDREKRYANGMELRNEFARLLSGKQPTHNLSANAPTLPYAPVPSAVTARNPLPEAPVSRPTTRLLLAAAHLSTPQLLGLGAAILVILVGLAWFLSPVLSRMSIDWNSVPIVALFGALGYAAYPKRGIAFVSHTLFTTILVITIWTRLNQTYYSFTDLLVAAVASGVLMEAWVFFLPIIKGKKDAWLLEAFWLGVMAMLGTVLFFGLLTNWYYLGYAVQWILGFVFGLAGWFVGDLLRQALKPRHPQ